MINYFLMLKKDVLIIDINLEWTKELTVILKNIFDLSAKISLPKKLSCLFYKDVYKYS
jgi:hypothetical protein